jgi:WD40 repeat protein
MSLGESLQTSMLTFKGAMPYKAFISYSHAADSKLAPALQSALRRIGTPWYQRASFRIFLDNSSLSANPALWQAVETALGQSEYLLLCASTLSARSAWVKKEIDWWLAHRKADNILLLVTEGEIAWHPGERDFDWQQSTALNPELRGQFKDEPLWVDLRWARSENNLSLRNQRFRSAVLQIAPPLYGKQREDLDDADTRQSKSAQRLAAVGIIALASLLVGIAFSLRSARHQGQAAQQQRSVADCRELAGKAMDALDTRLDLALLLSVEDSRHSSCIEGRGALLSALEKHPRFAGFLSGHTDRVTRVAYSHDGHVLASSSWDKTVRLWDPQSHRAVGPVLKGMYGIALNPDGTLLASADGESVKLWKLSDGSPAGDLPGLNREEMSRVGFSPDGKLIAASNEPNGVTPSRVRLWNVATREASGNPIPAQIFAFSPDSKLLATDGDDRKSVVLWNLQTRKTVGKPLLGHTANLHCISFSKDGNLLAAGGDDHNVIAWDLHQPTATGVPFVGHRAAVNDVAFSPVDNIMASASGDGSIILWNLETAQPIGAPLTVGEAPVFSLAFSPDGRQIASMSDERVALWSAPDKLPINHTVPIPERTESGPVYSPDGNIYASLDTYGSVNLSNAETGAFLAESLGQRQTSVAFSPDNKQFATVSWDGILAFWDRATGDPVGDPVRTNFRLWSVAFSPDGRTVAVGGDSVFLLWDTHGRRWKTQSEHLQKDRLWSVAFSPDGKLVAAAGLLTFAVWDGQTGANLVAPIATGAKDLIGARSEVAFSPDGKTIAYPTTARGVALWDVQRKAELVPPLSGHSGLVISLAFSPDNRFLATAGEDGKVVLWDVPTHQPVGGPFTGVGDEIQGLAFRPHHSELAVLGNTRMLVWDVDENSWRKTACWLVNRNLSHDEWSKFLGAQTPYTQTCDPSLKKTTSR